MPSNFDGVEIESPRLDANSFNGKTLNIPSQTLVHSDDVNVNLGGSLTYPTINIPANTPTEIFSYDDEESWDYGNWTIDIQENGRWVERYQLIRRP